MIIGLLASTGLRTGEAIALTIDDVRLGPDPPQLYIRKAKFYKSRIVPIHSSTADQLRAYLQDRNRVKRAGRRKRSLLPEGSCPSPMRHSAECSSN